MTRLERATPWSQTKYTTNCTTSRMLSLEKRCKITNLLTKRQIYLKNSDILPIFESRIWYIKEYCTLLHQQSILKKNRKHFNIENHEELHYTPYHHHLHRLLLVGCTLLFTLCDSLQVDIPISISYTCIFTPLPLAHRDGHVLLCIGRLYGSMP